MIKGFHGQSYPIVMSGRDYVVSIRDGPWLLNDKWDVRQVPTGRSWTHAKSEVKSIFGLISPNQNSLNFKHVIEYPKIICHWINAVGRDRRLMKSRNHWISPNVTAYFWKEHRVVSVPKLARDNCLHVFFLLYKSSLVELTCEIIKNRRTFKLL